MKLPPPMTTEAQWEEAYSGSFQQPLLVFKHSTSCSISSGAYDELSNWLEDAATLSLRPVMVLVPDNRPLSTLISEKLSLKHESPQLILVIDGKVSWHASHWRITYSTLDEHLGTHCEK
ncbi:bacillithiol system redox-active protein YtxJ [Paenibacillus lignilyticus]|uniref:Bacillithiol system redox-active protein YtxJ n=1 Tax=Paenibacillus lignilyticus TaxID=1172615 RepID=A0ABS5C581_9BACL|nr:bacillithiol system redox-active protein YtxJ [Paenibacillus lignilyticus]MBP3961157.1 bacillithiol system redox-active protein YtxJ [Paenibacillus lignilyticus]